MKKAVHGDEILTWPANRIKENNLGCCKIASNFKRFKDK